MADILINWYVFITPPRMLRFRWNLVDWCKMTRRWWRCKLGNYKGSRTSIWRLFVFLENLSIDRPTSAVDWGDVSSKFGLQTALVLLKWGTLPNPRKKVEVRCRGHHLEQSIWYHNYSAVVGAIWIKFDRPRLLDMRIEKCPNRPQPWPKAANINQKFNGLQHLIRTSTAKSQN